MKSTRGIQNFNFEIIDSTDATKNLFYLLHNFENTGGKDAAANEEKLLKKVRIFLSTSNVNERELRELKDNGQHSDEDESLHRPHIFNPKAVLVLPAPKKGNSYHTLMSLAAEKGLKTIVEQLTPYYATKKERLIHSLMLAALRGHDEIVRHFLYNVGVDPLMPASIAPAGLAPDLYVASFYGARSEFYKGLEFASDGNISASELVQALSRKNKIAAIKDVKFDECANLVEAVAITRGGKHIFNQLSR